MRYFGRWAGLLMAMYAGSYVVLSLMGSYGYWWVSGTGPKYMWYPMGFGMKSRVNEAVWMFYLPLWQVDRLLWHTQRRRDSGEDPSVDDWM